MEIHLFGFAALAVHCFCFDGDLPVQPSPLSFPRSVPQDAAGVGVTRRGGRPPPSLPCLPERLGGVHLGIVSGWWSLALNPMTLFPWWFRFAGW